MELRRAKFRLGALALCALLEGLASGLLYVEEAHAARRGLPVTPDEIFSAVGTVHYRKPMPSGKKKAVSETVTLFCLSEGRIPGKLRSGAGGFTFLPYTTIAKNLKRKIRLGKSSDRRKLSRFRAIAKSTICGDPKSEGEKSGDPTPTPTPGGDPNPTPTPGGGGNPTPTPSPHFDQNGNLTLAGKLAFGVPTELSGNIAIGEGEYNQRCQLCHEPRGFLYHFPELRYLTVTVMGIPEQDLPDPVLANIVAYLNQFDP